MTDSPLARYQSAILALFLRDDLDHDARLRHLQTDPELGPYAKYVATFDPAFVEQGVTATKHWGGRTPTRARSGANKKG